MKLANSEHYIQGAWVEGRGQAFLSVNPIDSSRLWQGNIGTTEEVEAAVFAADKALSSWAMRPIEQRIEYLRNFAEAVKKHRDVLNNLISLETGKPRWEAETETNSVIAKIEVSIQAYQERNREKINKTDNGQNGVRYKPQGVVVVLGAFNFPAHLSNGHIVPALLAGNTVIYKPSELSPAVAALVMQCWHESGIPAGVINCIQGDASTAVLILNANIQGVFFTGSYTTGKRIHQQFSGRPEVILALEMGGNNPLIIDDSIRDVEAAIYHTLLSAYLTAGQRCTCARRIFVPNSSKGTRFIDLLIKAAQQIKVGAFTDDPGPFMGPVIRHEHARRHIQAQEALVEFGGVPLLPMKLLKPKSGLLSPGLVDMTSVENPLDEEIFAPLLQVYRYTDFETALKLANSSRYGLVAALFSDSRERYQQFYETIHAGLINWNKPTTGAVSSLPFGGVGASGNHRPSAWFAADYCSYPIAIQEETELALPQDRLPGLGA